MEFVRRQRVQSEVIYVFHIGFGKLVFSLVFGLCLTDWEDGNLEVEHDSSPPTDLPVKYLISHLLVAAFSLCSCPLPLIFKFSN